MHTASLYHIRCFGCQMNKHDSEVVAGLLDAMGMFPTEDPDTADVIVFLTCCVRENADRRLYGQVASLRRLKTDRRAQEGPAPIIAVGGCIGQRDGAQLCKRLPHVDIVFGTHNIAHLPRLIAEVAEQRCGTARVEILQESTDFAADLPTHRAHAFHAWLPITQGCNNHCSYCIVPSVRGQQRSRPLADITAAAQALVADGVREITLLGQNVNSYGRDRYGRTRFADALRLVAESGVTRLGFTTSHPRDLLPETIGVMARYPAILRYLHLPVQSGSNRILSAMNRRYTREDYLALVARLREALPDLALSTDIIVGFPGETEADFAETLALADTVAFDQAFTFLYSPRQSTPAATMPDQVLPEVAQERFERLVDCVQTHALARNRLLVNTTQEVLIEGASKRNPEMLSGRTRGYKMCHLALPATSELKDYVGECVQTRVREAHTWYLECEWI
jgi:tRNA-2-methylthio-N6-dimethylallyladenosine synthase